MIFDPRNPFLKPSYAPNEPVASKPQEQTKPGSSLEPKDSVFNLNNRLGPTVDQMIADMKRHSAKYYNPADPTTYESARKKAIETFRSYASKHPLVVRGPYFAPGDFAKVAGSHLSGLKREAGVLKANGKITEAKELEHSIHFLETYVKKNT